MVVSHANTWLGQGTELGGILDAVKHLHHDGVEVGLVRNVVVLTQYIIVETVPVRLIGRQQMRVGPTVGGPQEHHRRPNRTQIDVIVPGAHLARRV